MKRIYIAGPYSKGDTAFNIRTAILTADLLTHYGLFPFIPHLTHFWHFLTPHPIEFWYEQDNEWLRSCDALLRLEGESYGADREVEMAKQLGLPVFYSVSDLVKAVEEQNAKE